ncbi:MAG: tripartite tricarboxylate transporter TctB family protein [Treponemataceae bacterium]
MAEEVTKSKRFGVNQLIPFAMTAIAVVFIWLGISVYGFWSATKGPLPGFFPVVVAVCMLFAGIFAYISSFKEKEPVWPRANWLVVLSVALIMGATFLIGLLPSIAVYVLVWLKGYEKCSWKTTLITFAFIMFIVIGCFVLWLGVPFPKGIIFERFFN